LALNCNLLGGDTASSYRTSTRCHNPEDHKPPNLVLFTTYKNFTKLRYTPFNESYCNKSYDELLWVSFNTFNLYLRKNIPTNVSVHMTFHVSEDTYLIMLQCTANLGNLYLYDSAARGAVCYKQLQALFLILASINPLRATNQTLALRLQTEGLNYEYFLMFEVALITNLPLLPFFGYSTVLDILLTKGITVYAKPR